MKLLHVIGELDARNGGTYTALLAIVNMLSELGHNNYVIATEKENQLIEASILYDNSMLFKRSFPKKFRKSTSGSKWMQEHIKEYDAIIIHEIWGGIGIDACKIAFNNKIDYHIWPHGSLDPFDLKKKFYLKKLIGEVIVHKLLCNAKYICCTSELEKERIENFGRKAENRIVLPLPVTKSNQFIGDRKKFRSKYGLNEQQTAYLFLSRIDYKKGLELIVLAFAELFKEGCLSIGKVKLFIAGTGTKKYIKKITTLISQHHLEETIIFVGMLTGQEKEDAFVGNDFFLLPSMNENFGLSIIESLQRGLPVIISDNVYIHKEIFKNGECGWLCEYSVESLKEAIVDSFNTKNIDQIKINAMESGKAFFPEKLKYLYKSVFSNIYN